MQIKILLLTLLWSGGGARCEHVHDVHRNADNDKGTLKDLVLKFLDDIDQLETKVDALSRQSAFQARFSSLHPSSPASGPFRFDAVVFNTGGNYDSTLGVYTAPHSGIYTFSVQIFGQGSQSTRIMYDVMVNGVTHTRSSSQVPPLDDVSVPVTFSVHLQKGDEVWVQTFGGWVYNLWGTYHSLFTGALISADTR